MGGVSAPEWSPHARVATDAAACGEMLAASGGDEESELDSSDIRIVNWNMQKAQHADSYADLVALADDTDLILIQEAALKVEFLQPLDTAKFWSFAPGYRRGEELTGVITLSASMPLTRCSLTTWEPWLRTPKATSVTEYALSGTDESLVVVNIHAVNFTIGTQRFRKQIEEVLTVLHEHDGPVILSGDFNTWRNGRLDVVRDISERLGLRSVHFDNDKRKRVFGKVLDHVYVRGLTRKGASTRFVSTSDHNPMTVRFAYQ